MLISIMLRSWLNQSPAAKVGLIDVEWLTKGGLMTDQPDRYQNLVREDAVHGSAYFDPEIFREELRSIFCQEWVYIGHDSEVPNVGDFRRKTMGVQPVILCRDDGGNVQVLFNRCRHRAASVCQMERGTATQFRCEYHGWVYALNGDLTHVPYS